MKRTEILDLVGIGIGPFNLGLAALCAGLPELNCLFLDEKENFNWHPGLLFSWARLQVPFYADLVTLADPSSPYSYLSYLKRRKKLFRFAIAENYFIKRTEYNDYCRWVVSELSNLKFDTKCLSIHYNTDLDCYEIKTTRDLFLARRLVIGTGTVPAIPSSLKLEHPLHLHSSQYLFRREELLRQERVTVIGSGQSAAEIVYDLLRGYQGEIYWFTRSKGFIPMDYSKFALEMASPDYMDHFYLLDADVREKVLRQQDFLYKGINASLINDIYELLNERKGAPIYLHPNCECHSISLTLKGSFYHKELRKTFTHDCGSVVMATGYHYKTPNFLLPVAHLINWDQKGRFNIQRNYSVDSDNRIFVQNADLHSHGFNSADLGLGPYRNSVILNSLLGRTVYQTESNVTFQTFGMPVGDKRIVKELKRY